MGEVIRRPSICRFCTTGCPVIVETVDNRVVKVSGNKESPSYYGFCCTRGQAVPEQFENPERLLTSMKRTPDGAYEPLPSHLAIDEIAAAVQDLIEKHGPDSVAGYIGTHAYTYAASSPFMTAFFRSIGSRSLYTPATIDQPGKAIASALIGGWEAGPNVFGESDVWMIIGGNGLISITITIPGQNPGRRLTDALESGMKLIVIDPRRTETASRAHVHLQPRPGEDATIVAGMIRLILAEGLQDQAFVADNVDGVEALRRAVAPFTPAYVAERADISEEDFISATRTFAMGRKGIAVGATGVNMSGHSSLTEFLILALNVICGRFLRAGDKVCNPGVLLPPARPKAQPKAPRQAANIGPAVSVRGLAMSAAGMPTAALADEILSGKIKALISVCGNPVAAWPDQKRTIAALEKLDLFVQLDIKMSASAKLADYVIAPKMAFEVPTASYQKESNESASTLAGQQEPMGLYAPALIDPPSGSDLVEEWELFYELARRMELPLELTFHGDGTCPNRAPRRPISIDMQSKPTMDDLLELLTQESRIPLSEVKKHPNGAVFPGDIFVAAKDKDCTTRMNVGNADMLNELGDVLGETPVALRAADAFPFLLISRRMSHVYNSSGRDMPKLVRKGGAFNPAFIHSAVLSRLGLAEGDQIVLESRHGSLPAIVAVDDGLREDVISMSHAFGDLPSEGRDIRKVGSNTGVLISVEDDYDRISGIPRMSAVPVRVAS